MNRFTYSIAELRDYRREIQEITKLRDEANSKELKQSYDDALHVMGEVLQHMLGSMADHGVMRHGSRLLRFFNKFRRG